MIDWKRAKAQDQETVSKIVARAVKDPQMGSLIKDKLSLDMDLMATHISGCPLNLDRLLRFEDADFWHDILGIRANINRENGKLENCFLPRCARD